MGISAKVKGTTIFLRGIVKFEANLYDFSGALDRRRDRKSSIITPVP
jgi:hypothetical protein